MQLPTHAQPSQPSATQSAVMASLCRTDPALWARVVRREDWYVGQGWGRDAAARQAEVDYGLRPAEESACRAAD